MKKKIVIFLMLTSVLNLVSCVVICSSKSNMYIVNNTEDTLLICCAYYAEFDEIDSVDYFLPAEWDVSLEGDTKLGRDGKLKISNKNLIPPDSAGNYCRTLLSYGPRLGNDNDEKGYFFILKLEVAQSYTWKEIRNERLYDTLVISREMLGKNKNRRFLIERGITGTVPKGSWGRFY